MCARLCVRVTMCDNLKQFRATLCFNDWRIMPNNRFQCLDLIKHFARAIWSKIPWMYLTQGRNQDPVPRDLTLWRALRTFKKTLISKNSSCGRKPSGFLAGIRESGLCPLDPLLQPLRNESCACSGPISSAVITTRTKNNRLIEKNPRLWLN